MRSRKFWAALVLGLGWSGIPAHAEIYTIFSDAGFPPSTAPFNVIQFSGDSTKSGFNGSAADITPPEGFTSYKTTMTVFGYAGWGFDYGVSPNLSRFSSGELRFWIYSTSPEIGIDIKDADSNNQAYYLLSVNLHNPPYNLQTKLNQWVPITIPLNGVDLSKTRFPFLATAIQGSCTFYIDNVRYVNTAANPIFNITVKNISNNQLTNDLTWSNVSLPTGWVRADQYIELETDVQVPSWGVQIYTDNTNSAADPKFVSAVPAGQAGSNPAGLVALETPSRTLPLAWSIKSTVENIAGTATSPANPPIKAEPNDNGLNGHPTDINAFQWLYMQDAKTPEIAIPPTHAFVNGDQDPFVLVRSNKGNHFGQDPLEFGAQNPPSYIFLEANFGSAVTPQTYKTSTVTLEFFYQ